MGNKNVIISLAMVNSGIDLMIKNATRLYSDAELLYNHKRFPTSCSLAVLSIEELGRIFVCLKAAKTDPENKEEMKAVQKALSGHIEKQSIVQMLEAFRSKDGEIEKAYVALNKIEESHGINNIKQWGFYVDPGNGIWLTPNDRVNEDHTRCLLNCASALISFFSRLPVGVF